MITLDCAEEPYRGWWDKLGVAFARMIGATLIAVDRDGDEALTFRASDGRVWLMRHSQDCCEHVYLQDVAGDFEDLIGSPILLAEEATSEQPPEDFTHKYEPESQTWTFYKLATAKGHVTLRWFGESNGYYSESVDFDQIAGAAPVKEMRR